MSDFHELRPLTAIKPAATSNGHPLKVAFWTLGCRLNQYDTEGIKTSMAGVYDIDVVSWNDPAHLYVSSSFEQGCRGRLLRPDAARSPGGGS